MRPTALERFTEKYAVDPATGCWLWQGAKQTKGYGSFGPGGKGKSILAHRWAWEHVTTEKHAPSLLGDLQCGQTCRNKLCVNPDHLEAASHRSFNKLKTHCKHGHELNEENVLTRPNGRRRCKACDYRRNREYRTKAPANLIYRVRRSRARRERKEREQSLYER